MDAREIDKLNHQYLEGEKNLDINEFNRDFEEYVKVRNRKIDEKLQKNLAELNKEPETTPLYQLSIGEIIVNTVDTLFGIINDFLKGNITLDILTKENRLFYLGVVFVIIACVLYFYNFFIISGNQKRLSPYVVINTTENVEKIEN